MSCLLLMSNKHKNNINAMKWEAPYQKDPLNYPTSLLSYITFIKIPNVQHRTSTVSHLKVERLVSGCSSPTSGLYRSGKPAKRLPAYWAHVLCHWLTFDVSPSPLPLSFLPLLLGLLSPLCSALLSCFVPQFLSPLLFSFLVFVSSSFG